MHTKEQLNEMKSEHDEWQNRIKFYRDEIKQFNHHLGKVAQPGAPKDLLASVEHFQNQFIRQSEVLDIIRHDFKQHENLIEALDNPERKAPEESIQKIHSTQREKLDQFEKIFHELRGEFNVFLNKVI
jgi:predicted metal-dependent phosphoesterase TrpH